MGSLVQHLGCQVMVNGNHLAKHRRRCWYLEGGGGAGGGSGDGPVEHWLVAWPKLTMLNILLLRRSVPQTWQHSWGACGFARVPVAADWCVWAALKLASCSAAAAPGESCAGACAGPCSALPAPSIPAIRRGSGAAPGSAGTGHGGDGPSSNDQQTACGRGQTVT